MATKQVLLSSLSLVVFVAAAEASPCSTTGISNSLNNFFFKLAVIPLLIADVVCLKNDFVRVDYLFLFFFYSSFDERVDCHVANLMEALSNA